MAIGAHTWNGHIIYPEDIAKLKSAIPEIRILHDSVIEDLYSTFSDSWYCASWLNVTENSIKDFREFLFTDKVL